MKFPSRLFARAVAIATLIGGMSHASAQTPAPAVLQINAGGAASGTWVADEYASGGTPNSSPATINTMRVPNPAPQATYQSERYGAFTYTIPGLSPGARYPVNLHFAEIYWSAPGQRQFNVLVNGTQVLTNFDILATAGGKNMAIVRSFSAKATSAGKIKIQFTTGAADLPKVSGIEILPAVDATGIVSGSVVNLVSDTSGLALDNQGSTAGGNPVWQWSAGAGNTNQQWQIDRLANGNYTLVNLSSGMALDNGGSTNNGALVTQQVASSTDTRQQWAIDSVGGGFLRLVNASSGKALDNSGAQANGGSVWQWDVIAGSTNQMWKLVPVQIGANAPFTSYEAEDAALGGGARVVALTAAPTTKFSSPQLEASGHAFVHLAGTGQSASFTNATGHKVTAINVRYSIPDAANGGGIASTLDLYVDGAFRQAINVNSIQTWVYESANSYDGFSQNPADGTPHVFWDETHAFIAGAPVAPGSTITLQKDLANSAAYYDVDVIDLEAPPAPLAQPANSLSVVADCGAVANSKGFDSTGAIQNCINSAQSQGKSVWIPQGTFYLNASPGLNATGITIQGAGMWYSTIYYHPPLPAASTSNVFLTTSTTLRNFAIDGNAVSETTIGGNGGAINMKGSNWLIDSLWIQHEGAGVWADGTNGTVQNCRLGNTWADGINLNNGNGGAGNDTGANLSAKNNFIRGSGDDGLAINDSSLGKGMTDITLIANTVVAPWWANDIGIYGGSNDLVANNLVTDSVKEYGISVGIFTVQGGPVRSATVQGNTVLRGGSFGYANQYPGIGIGVTGTPSSIANVTVRGNKVVDAMFGGVRVYSGSNMKIDNNVVDEPALGGFAIDASAQGNAALVCNTAMNLLPGQPAYTNNAGSGFSATGSCNVGFSVP